MITDQVVMPIVDELLGCLEIQAALMSDPPANVGVRPGAVMAFLLGGNRNECCEGIAWIRPGPVNPSSDQWPSPDEAPRRGGNVGWAVQIELGYARCAPTGEPTTVPTEDQWYDTLAHVQEGAAALRNTVCCYINANRELRQLRVLYEEGAPLEIEGGCVGTTLLVTIYAAACECPPGSNTGGS